MSDSVAPTPPAGPVRSPVAVAEPSGSHAGWLVSTRTTSAALTLSDLTPLGKLAVRAPYAGAMRDALGVGFGRSAPLALGGHYCLVIGSGPGEWLVLAAAGARIAAEVAADLTGRAATTGEFVSVLDLTHGRALLRLAGAAAADALGRVCAVDLGADTTPDGAALRTSVAGLVTDVVRADGPAGPAYLLHCERSSGQYLYDALLAAAAEFGVQPAGFVPLFPPGPAR